MSLRDPVFNLKKTMSVTILNNILNLNSIEKIDRNL